MIKGTNNISEQIHLINILQQGFIHEKLKNLGLNEMQARTLNYVYTFPGNIQKDLATYLGKQNATITNILKLLEKKKYIRREIPEGNERQKKIYITEAGEKLVEGIQTIFLDMEELIVSALENEEIDSLKAGLKKICDHMK